MALPSARPAISAPLPDLIAGLSIAGLLVPEAVAYSGIASLPPQFGIIALLAGLLCYGLVGRSRFAVVSATSSSAAVLAAATATLSGGDTGLRFALAAGLIILTGFFFVAAGVARLGAISNFIAKPVLRGFAFGLAVVIILKQLPSIAGVAPQHADLLRYAFDLLRRIGDWNPIGVATGFIALAILLALRPYKRIPASLLVIVLGIATQVLYGIDRHGVGLVGAVDLQLQIPRLPQLPWRDWLRLGEVAFALLFVLYAESYSSIRGFALKHGDDVSANRELVALGVANLASGIFHGMPVGAGYSGTSANEAAGAQSRWAAWIAALVVLAIVLTLLPYVALTPQPILAAIVINAVSHTLNPGALRLYFRWRRDRVVALAAVAAVLLLGILDGLLAAVGVSLLMTLRDLSEPKVSVLGRLGQSHDFIDVAAHPEAKQIPGLLIVRPEEPLFFANADRMFAFVRQRIDAAGGAAIHTIILSLEESPDLDGTCIEALEELARHLAQGNIHLLLARLKDPVLAVLNHAAIPNLPPTALNNWSVDDAVSAALGKNDIGLSTK
ncbi:MAG: SulP family inorganic anion transporter [Thiobacillaceae bacterium]